MAGNKPQKEFVPLQIAVVTVSDTRTEDNDTSGQYLVDVLAEQGHHLYQKHICKDDVDALRALVKMLIDDVKVHAVLLTGGTGFTIPNAFPDATATAIVRGNETTKLVYFVYPGGEPRYHYKFCPGLDTTYTEIIY